MHALFWQHLADVSSLFSFDRVLFPMYLKKIKVNLVTCCDFFFGWGRKAGEWERDRDEVANEKLCTIVHEFIWEMW